MSGTCETRHLLTSGIFLMCSCMRRHPDDPHLGRRHQPGGSLPRALRVSCATWHPSTSACTCSSPSGGVSGCSGTCSGDSGSDSLCCASGRHHRPAVLCASRLSGIELQGCGGQQSSGVPPSTRGRAVHELHRAACTQTGLSVTQCPRMPRTSRLAACDGNMPLAAHRC